MSFLSQFLFEIKGEFKRIKNYYSLFNIVIVQDNKHKINAWWVQQIIKSVQYKQQIPCKWSQMYLHSTINIFHNSIALVIVPKQLNIPAICTSLILRCLKSNTMIKDLATGNREAVVFHHFLSRITNKYIV